MREVHPIDYGALDSSGDGQYRVTLRTGEVHNVGSVTVANDVVKLDAPVAESGDLREYPVSYYKWEIASIELFDNEASDTNRVVTKVALVTGLVFAAVVVAIAAIASGLGEGSFGR